MRVDLFDFALPEDRIALKPAVPRDSARLLAVTPPRFGDHTVRDLPGLLRPGDCLVFNDTRVIKAALDGIRVRGATAAKVAFNLIKRTDPETWQAFARPAKRLMAGDRVVFSTGPNPGVTPGPCLTAIIAGKGEAGEVDLQFDLSGAALDEAIAATGSMPLPPYIALKRPTDADDARDYQTMFAARDGAVAAPTAALHFTPELMSELERHGITHQTVTLHVGAGTFLPMKVEETSLHKMHAEWGEITPATAAALNAVRARGGRIVAVGTTAARLIETAAAGDGTIAPFSGETAIFITPGTAIKATDVLMTNFHLPKSTLFMLVSAFCGLETMQEAYAHAIAHRYRFYSYGDACLLFPDRTNMRQPITGN